MEINRNNYQIWITDFFDGELDIRSEEILMEFLENNVDLKAEFEEFRNFILHPDISIRTFKEKLRKDADQLEEEQVEKLVIAYVENDLSEVQEDEIGRLVVEDERFTHLYNIYRNLRLNPSKTGFPGKRSLKMIPYMRRIRRISIGAISAAASLIFLIAFSLLFRQPVQEQVSFNSTALNSIRTAIPGNENISAQFRQYLANWKPEKVEVIEKSNGITGSEEITALSVPREDLYLEPARIAPEIEIGITESPVLLAEILFEEDEPYEYPEPLSPRQFIARNFREIVLSEEEGSVDRIKAYEIADAGIRGINKILGWEMSLQKEISENGQVSSLKFTSQLVNFDHKPKKVAE